MNDHLLRAAKLVNDVLSEPDGGDIFFLATIYHSLVQCERDIPLTREDTLALTFRLFEAAGMSTIPLLTAERADAVRYLLEYGITETMCPEFTALSADNTKRFLLTCDLGTFVDLVDAVAIDSQEYYAPDYGAIDDTLVNGVNQVIQRMFLPVKQGKSAIDNLVSTAESKLQPPKPQKPNQIQSQQDRS